MYPGGRVFYEEKIRKWDTYTLDMKSFANLLFCNPMPTKEMKWNPSNPPREIWSLNCALAKPVLFTYIQYLFPQIGWDLYIRVCLSCDNPLFSVCMSLQLAWCNSYIRWLYPNNKLSLVLSIQVVRVLTHLFLHLKHEVISGTYKPLVPIRRISSRRC